MNNLFTILCGAALLGLGGCSHESEAPDTSRIMISPVITRVAGLNFEDGDRIGLTVTCSSGIYANNVMMSYSGDVFSSSELDWYATDDASTLTAYYPYLQSGIPSEFQVAADQSAGCEASDLLAATKEKVTPSSSAVGMVFQHLLSVVNITVTNKTATPVSELYIGGTRLEADVDLKAQTATVKSSAVAADIKACPQTVNERYQAVVVPQTAALVLTVKTSDGKSLSMTLAENTFLQGKSYSVDLGVEKDKLTLKLSGEVTDWEQGGALKPGTGDGGGEGGGEEPPADNGTMECVGITYKTVNYGNLVWMAENLRSIPVGKVGDEVFYPGGIVSDENVNIYGMLYYYDTAVALCPAGWRIPTEADFTSLMAELGTNIEDTFVPLSGAYNPVYDYTMYDVMGYLTGSTPSAEENKVQCLSKKSGKALQISSKILNDQALGVRYVKDVR